jgi:Na+-transporting NADH:ubiquinone oxidoreductase subunit C
MPPKDSIANTLLVSVVLCVFCSLLVSGAAVSLRPLQERNKQLDRQRNIIAAAALAPNADRLSGREVEELFKQRVQRRMVDLETGTYVSNPDESFEPRKAAKNPQANTAVEGFDIGIARREKQTWVYLITNEGGQIEKVVLPIYGMGLWSTLYGYIALESDLRTVAGLTFYEHAETPGLGGEVENPAWRDKWIGKQIWATDAPPVDENLRIGVAKAAPQPDNVPYMVDGLSGATITSRGVDSMLKYWFSSEGFGPFLKQLASQQGVADNGNANS